MIDIRQLNDDDQRWTQNHCWCRFDGQTGRRTLVSDWQDIAHLCSRMLSLSQSILGLRLTDCSWSSRCLLSICGPTVHATTHTDTYTHCRHTRLFTIILTINNACTASRRSHYFQHGQVILFDHFQYLHSCKFWLNYVCYYFLATKHVGIRSGTLQFRCTTTFMLLSCSQTQQITMLLNWTLDFQEQECENKFYNISTRRLHLQNSKRQYFTRITYNMPPNS